MFPNRAYTIRNDEDKLLGFFYFKYLDNSLEMDELEILHQYRNKGYGSSFVKQLFKRINPISVITGIAAVDAVCFWRHLGATMRDSCSMCNDKEICTYLKNGQVCNDYMKYNFTLRRENLLV
jgi:predicted acetyltransferase